MVKETILTSDPKTGDNDDKSLGSIPCALCYSKEFLWMKHLNANILVPKCWTDS